MARCGCFFCRLQQDVPEPPALHRCISCKRDFRVLWNEGGGSAEYRRIATLKASPKPAEAC